MRIKKKQKFTAFNALMFHVLLNIGFTIPKCCDKL